MSCCLNAQDDSLDDLLGPGSATSCGTALDWDQSDELAQSILPGLFGDDDADIGASPFDIMDFGDSGKLLVRMTVCLKSETVHVPCSWDGLLLWTLDFKCAAQSSTKYLEHPASSLAGIASCPWCCVSMERDTRAAPQKSACAAVQ